MIERSPLFSVVVPTRGESSKLLPLLDALERQTLPRNRFEILVSFDGVAPALEISRRLSALGGRTLEARARRGPGAARNIAAGAARGDYLAFTEDDCLPASDWLEVARGKTVHQLEALVAGKSPGDKPSSASQPDARRHALRFDVAPETLAYSFLLDGPYVDVVLVGATEVGQLKTNLECATGARRAELRPAVVDLLAA